MEQPIRAAIIQNGVITNIIWVMTEELSDFKAIPVTDEFVGIGWLYENGIFIDPNPPVVEEEIPVEG